MVPEHRLPGPQGGGVGRCRLEPRPLPRQVLPLWRLPPKRLRADAPALHPLLLEQQLSQWALAQTLDGAPRPFDRGQWRCAASPDRGAPIDAQNHLADMALAAAQSGALLRPQGLASLADHLNTDRAMATKACRERAWRTKPAPQTGWDGAPRRALEGDTRAGTVRRARGADSRSDVWTM